MAISIASILLKLGPIALDAARVFAGMQRSDANLKSEERIRTLEEEVTRIADVTARLAEQTKAIAEAVRVQDILNAKQAKQLKVCLVISIVATCVAVGAIVVVGCK